MSDCYTIASITSYACFFPYPFLLSVFLSFLSPLSCFHALVFDPLHPPCRIAAAKHTHIILFYVPHHLPLPPYAEKNPYVGLLVHSQAAMLAVSVSAAVQWRSERATYTYTYNSLGGLLYRKVVCMGPVGNRGMVRPKQAE
jgi:hypothetical protein